MKHFICALLFMLSTFSTVIGQSSSDKLGIGFNLGGQLIYGDGDYKAGFGIGLETYLRYKLDENFSLVTSLGYGELSDGTFHLDESNFTTNMITFDIKGVYDLVPQGTFKPLLYAGLGAFSFKNDIYDRRYGDFSVFVGGGFEYMVNPTLGLIAHADYRYTTSEDLDNLGDNDNLLDLTSNDGYLNIRGGFTYYFGDQAGAKKPKVLADRAPIDEIEGTGGGGELSGIVDGLNEYDETAGKSASMDEYFRLKSRVDELNDAIRQKELEIGELETQLESRKARVSILEQGMRTGSDALSASLDMDMSDFSTTYETALNNFYSHEYDASIYMFKSLIDTYPDHPLISNCHYWIGECYFGKDEYENAIQAFQVTLTYPSEVKKDDALLMLGRSYLKLGDSETARQMFERLQQDYPDSEYIDKANAYSTM
ncbi:tetratricopeptide repeat protein [candidate division KSB1 bacterium]|nr:tetratricopeptide repeat protein [candidate division KSB1 bacterium]